MRHKSKLIIIFYVAYFTWLFLLTYLWPDPKLLSFFLMGITVFYFSFLYEKYDIWFFLAVFLLSFPLGSFITKEEIVTLARLSYLNIPFWPFAWGITALALRKFYLTI